MTTPSASTPAQPRVHTASPIEILESRIAPAATAPGVFSYTDGNGDTVKVEVSGKFTSVDFLSSTAGDVLTAGGDIASIVVHGAKSDFALTFVDTNPGVGDDVIKLGVITGEGGASLPLIKGVTTVDSNDAVTFELEGYKGAGFSTGGGLKILGKLTASGDGSGGLEIGTIKTGTSVYFRDGIAQGANALVSGKVSGTFQADGDVAGTVTLDSVSGIAKLGSLSNVVTVNRTISGQLLVDHTVSEGGTPLGQILVKGSVSPSARISSGDTLNVKAVGNVSGVLQAPGDVFLSTDKNLTGVNLTAGADLHLGVTGSVIGSSLIVRGEIVEPSSVGGKVQASNITAATELNLTVGRDVVGSRLAGGENGKVSVTGKMAASSVVAGADLIVSVGKTVAGSEILPDGDLTVQINGNVSSSQIGSRSATLEAIIAGKLSGSALIAGDEANVTVAKDWQKTSFVSASDAVIGVQGKVSGSRFVSGSNLKVTAGGNVSGSQLLPANDLELTVHNGGVASSRLESLDGDALVTVDKAIKATDIEAARTAAVAAQGGAASSVKIVAGIDANVGGAKQIAATITAARDVSITTASNFTGAVHAGGNLTASAARFAPAPSVPVLYGVKIQPGVHVAGDLSLQTTSDVSARVINVGGDVTNLNVGGAFKAVLRVAGDLIPGEVGTEVTAIAGVVAPSSLIWIGGDIGSSESAAKISFGGDFKGQLEVGGDVRTDLQFAGSVSRIIVNGSIGKAALGDGIAQIIVNGNVGSLSSGSLFERSGPGAGNFVDGTGEITGVLQATGDAAAVTPVNFIEPVVVVVV
ncbi:beta strand repeat-containing protein [Verrucomicrobiota bacterium sgz303538]